MFKMLTLFQTGSFCTAINVISNYYFVIKLFFFLKYSGESVTGALDVPVYLRTHYEQKKTIKSGSNKHPCFTSTRLTVFKEVKTEKDRVTL